jgi:phosphohistidine phosphatase
VPRSDGIISDIAMLILVHHADAVGPHVDPQRPLSPRGFQQADRLAAEVKAAGFSPAAIWHSGKLRGRQTGEAFLRLCNPFADFRMVRGLHSEDPPEWMRDELAADPRDLLLVGHMPHIADLSRMLLPGSPPIPLHGLIALEREDDRWVERWRLGAS